MKTKSTDLRTKTPVERAKMVINVHRLIKEPASQSDVANRLNINRRTVAKYYQEPKPEILYSPLIQLVNLIFKRHARRGLGDVLKEFGYNWKSSTEPQYQIARAQTDLGRDIDILLSFTGPKTKDKNLAKWNSFPGDRYEGNSIEQLITNKRPVKILLGGVLLSQNNILSDNLEFFRELALTHPDKKPKKLLEEATFCLWYLFGFRALKWIGNVEQTKLRWHIHKARSSSVR